MVPIIIIAYRWGMKWGFLTSFVYGILQLSLAFVDNEFAMPTIWALLAMLVIDYILAYTCLGLGGLFRNRFKSPWVALLLGCLVAVFARYFCHWISGAIFFGEYASWFFGDKGYVLGMERGAWILSNISGVWLSMFYSMIVNGITMLMEMGVTAVGCVALAFVSPISAKMDKK